MSQRPETRILLVDDDPVKRYTISKTLSRADFTVSEAESGREALRLVTSLPDLVILDVKLPDIDGFEVCRQIKSDPATAAIPVLHISTTFVDIEDKVHGLDRHGARSPSRTPGGRRRSALETPVANDI